jgi:plastocyanin
MTNDIEREMEMDAIEPGTSAAGTSSRTSGTRRTRLATRFIAGTLMVFGLAACASEVDPRGDVISGPARGEAIEIGMKSSAFDPPRLELTAGEEVQIEVTNQEDTMHDFTIDELDLSTGPLKKGEAATATIVVPESLTTYHCTMHDGMKGIIEGI